MHLLEIIGFNIEACFKAQSAGASRIELCSNPAGGGTTPSYGLIKAATQLLHVPVFVMIRPREGDFLYSDAEFQIMLADVEECRKIGCAGIVTGILTADGEVDKVRMSQLIKTAQMEVCFHRAFDRVQSYSSALEDVISLGCKRILTSGGKPNAEAGSATIAGLVQQSAGRISIMPGGGIRSGNIRQIALATGAYEFHSSSLIVNEGKMNFLNHSMNESLTYADVDELEVQRMVSELQTLPKGS